MKRYPSGYRTWTTEKHKTEGYRYMLLMNSVNDPNYEKGGKWCASTQWKFLEATEEPGWYRLVNRYYPEEYATWSPKERYLKMGIISYWILIILELIPLKVTSILNRFNQKKWTGTSTS